MIALRWIPAGCAALVGALGWAQAPRDGEPQLGRITPLSPTDSSLPEPFGPPRPDETFPLIPFAPGDLDFPPLDLDPGIPDFGGTRTTAPIDFLDALSIPGLQPSGGEVFVLPPVRRLSRSPRARPSVAIPVSAFSFEGNTAFSDEELAAVLTPYLEKGVLSAEDLENARQDLTNHYVTGGAPADADVDKVYPSYVTSGAVLPDQDPSEGTIAYDIVEGSLTDVRIRWETRSDDGESVPATKLLWDHFLNSRLRLAATTPLDLNRIQNRLQLLQRNPNIRRINAELKPDAQRGESYLDVTVAPARPYNIGVDIANDRPPSVGEAQVEITGYHTSITRNSDLLYFSYGLFQNGIEEGDVGGTDNISAGYTLPFTRWDTTLELGYESNSYAILEEPFLDLDITGESRRFRAGLLQPVFRNAHNEVTLGVAAQRVESSTALADIPFSLTPGAVDGEILYNALSTSQEWTNRGRAHVFAFRSELTFGIDGFDSTDDGSERTGEFFAWSAQTQAIRRFSFDNFLGIEGFGYDIDVAVRGGVQLSTDPLLSPQQFSLGGVNSVRGFRENRIVRDNGYFASLETRWPVLWNKSGDTLVHLVPFFDYGSAFDYTGDDDTLDSNSEVLASAGIGLQANLFDDRVNLEVYWGTPVIGERVGSGAIQDSGVHFRMSVRAF